MLGVSFRIFCGFCDSEVDFGSLGVTLVVLGWLSGVYCGSLEVPLERLGRNLGVILGSWGAVGSILEVWGCPWAPSARNRLERPKVSFPIAPF